MSSSSNDSNSSVLNLCICVPSAGTWDVDFGRSLVTATANFMLWTPPKEMGYRGRIFQILTADSSMLVRNRHDLVKASMKAGASHILFLDSDMTFPKDLFERMIMADVPILAANCTHRRHPVAFTAHDFEGDIIDSRGRVGLQAVRQVGCAVMMIKREVFEKAQPPYFLMDWTPEFQSYAGEDIYFCQVVQEAGFDVLIDHELSMDIEHVGRYRYGPKDIGALKRSPEEILAKARFDRGEKPFTLTELFRLLSQENMYSGTDKESRHMYGQVYDSLFKEWREKEIEILELGVFGGAASLAFAEFFPKAKITGVDLTLDLIPYKHPRIRHVAGDITMSPPVVDGSFDLIIDDGSHRPNEILATFELYSPMLKEGGIYLIEDIPRDEVLQRLSNEFPNFSMEVYDGFEKNGRVDERIAILRRKS